MAVRETQVLAANAAFYAAMRAGDATAMEALWSRARPLACTHPGRPMLHGRGAVLASWRQILGRPGAAVDIRTGPPAAVLAGRAAMVLCEERVGGARLMAINAFVEEPCGAWRMIGHHAAELP